MNNAGIDYGHGQTNIDTKTGIRYGVISQMNILDAWCEESEPYYGKFALCPHCGGNSNHPPFSCSRRSSTIWCLPAP